MTRLWKRIIAMGLRDGEVLVVQVKARRAALQQLRGRDARTERDRGLIEGQVVIEELPEVGVAGWNLSRAVAAGRHRVGELLADCVVELASGSLRAHS